MGDVERLGRKIHTARRPAVAGEVHPAHEPGKILAPEYVPEYEVLLQMQGCYKFQLTGRVQLATGQVQPVMVRGNYAQVGVAAVIGGGHGPREILVVKQAPGHASG